MAFKGEVQTTGDGETWSSNMLVFATDVEADTYVSDLAMRWTAVTNWRVTEIDMPVTHKIVNHELRKVDE